MSLKPMCFWWWKGSTKTHLLSIVVLSCHELTLADETDNCACVGSGENILLLSKSKAPFLPNCTNKNFFFYTNINVNINNCPTGNNFIASLLFDVLFIIIPKSMAMGQLLKRHHVGNSINRRRNLPLSKSVPDPWSRSSLSLSLSLSLSQM